MMRIPMRSRHGVTLALAALLLAAPGCGDDSPTAPDWNGPTVVRVSDPGGALDAHRAGILALVGGAVDSVRTVHPVTGVTITVFADGSRAIAGYGIGGRAPDATTVELYVDPSYPDLAAVLPDRLPAMVAHELHHVFRWRGPGYGRTLLEAMVSEGLADRFSVELLGVATPPWSDALDAGQADSMLALARPEFDSSSYDHARWFFGATPGVPRWSGYTLGYRFVLAYQSAHGSLAAIDLVATPAAEFRPQ
jgi:uncharacterized protein YjaZ